jgi:hypothetical protein
MLPVAFPKKRWLGIAPVLFRFGQAVGHGLGATYPHALRDDAPIEHADWKLTSRQGNTSGRCQVRRVTFRQPVPDHISAGKDD